MSTGVSRKSPLTFLVLVYIVAVPFWVLGAARVNHWGHMVNDPMGTRLVLGPIVEPAAQLGGMLPIMV